MSRLERQSATSVRFCCPFVPAEWIAAHGLRPVRVAPPATREHCPDGACPFAHAFFELSKTRPDEPFVFTTTCDQMRRYAELAAAGNPQRLFLMHVPTTWQQPSTMGLYRDELERLGRFLCQLGGETPSPAILSDAIREWETNRSELKRVSASADAALWPEMLRRFHEEGVISRDHSTGGRATVAHHCGLKSLPLALAGSPLLSSHWGLHGMIARLGGRVVLDATDFGERAFPRYGRCQVDEDPLGAMADAYFHGIPDAFRRPNDALYEWMDEHCARLKVRGIVFHRQIWCDTWHAEAQRMKERMTIPLLVLETGGEAELGAHTLSRLQAFLENMK